MSLLRDNLLPRLRLLRTALTRRFIYSDLLAQARDSGLVYPDVRGNLGPFDLVGPILSAPPGPDFSALIGPPAAFVSPGPAAFHSEPSVARFLGQLVFHQNPSCVVELGCFAGWATAHMACALAARGSKGRIFAVDTGQDCLDAMMTNLGRHAVAHLVQPQLGRSLDPAVLAALPERADLVFIDTSHLYPETIEEVLAYSARLAPGGLLALHDSVAHPGVRRSLEELPDRYDRLTFATEAGNGVTVLRPRP